MAVSVAGGSLEFDAVINMQQFDQSLARIEKQLGALTETAKKEATAIDNVVRRATAAIAAYATFTTATNFVKDIVTVRGEFQKLEISFKTMLKSKDAADQLMAQAIELAAKTPFTLQQVGEGAKQLLAYGFGAGQVTDNLKMLGDVAAGVGAPLGDIVYLYGTLRTQGRAYTKDIMQFTARGIPIISELAKQFGVAEEEVQGMVEAGKVGFPEVEQAFQSLTGSSGLFFNLMEEQSKSLTGQLSNLQDAWQSMLNEIGKSNEGIFNTAIQAAIALVKNYEIVIDILITTAAMYGTYKAALMATTVAEIASGFAKKGQTAAQILLNTATVIGEKVTKALNLALSSSPWVWAATAIVGVVTALYLFIDATDEAAEVQGQLAKVTNEAQKSIVEEQKNLDRLMKIAKDEKQSKEARLDAIKQINQISPEYLGNITLETVNTKAATDAVDKYSAALLRKARTTKAANAIVDLEMKRSDEQLKLNQSIADRTRGMDEKTKNYMLQFDPVLRKQIDAYDKLDKAIQGQINTLEGSIEADKKAQDQANSTGKAIIQNAAYYDEQIKAQQEALSQTTDPRNAEAIKAMIKFYQDKKEAIVGASEKEIESMEKVTDRAAQFYDDLMRLERDFAHREKPESVAIDELMDKYDELKIRVLELVEEGGLTKQQGQAAIDRLNVLHGKEEATKLKEIRTNIFKQELNDQQAMFTEYEQLKKEIGVKAARDLYKDRTKGVDTYLDYLQMQEDALKAGMTGYDSATVTKLLNEIGQKRIEHNRMVNEQIAKDNAAHLQDVLNAAQTLNDEELRLRRQFEDDMKVVRAKFGYSKEAQEKRDKLWNDLQEQLKIINQARQEQTEVFKLMNMDISNMSLAGLRTHIKAIDKIINSAEFKKLPAAVQQALLKIKEQFEKLEREVGAPKWVENFKKIEEIAGPIADGFEQIGAAVKEFDEGLGDTIETAGQLTNVLLDAVGAVAAFASGDIGGGIAKTVKAIVGALNIAAAARESERQARKDIEAFNQQIIEGEFEINALYRERERQQVRINKLRIQGLQDEQKLLEQQRATLEEQFAMVMRQLQEEQAVVGQTTEQYGGVFGIGRKTRAVDIYEALGGKTFAELEELFIKEQLTGKAKELFETLQKINEEMKENGELMADNLERTNESFSATTADAILDSITDGFASGLDSAADFADTFEELMRQSVINALKFEALQAPLKKFYEEFAAAATSDKILTEQEIAILRENFNRIITEAGEKFDELQKITGVDITAEGTAGGKGLSGAIKGISEQQADLLAGQFGGLRMTALQQVQIAVSHTGILIEIARNTSILNSVDRRLQAIELYGIKLQA